MTHQTDAAVSRPVDVLRWLSVLPAAVLGEFITRVVGALVGGMVGGAAAGSQATFSVQLVVYALAVAAFVLAGAYTAPSRRLIVALGLAAAAALLSLVKHVLLQDHPGAVNFGHLAAEITGAALAVAIVFDRERARHSGERPVRAAIANDDAVSRAANPAADDFHTRAGTA